MMKVPDMHRSYFPILLLISSFIGGCICKNVAVIGVMTTIHAEPDCKKINPTSVKILEAVNWLIDNLPENPNLKFEIDARDICGNLSAVPETLSLINKYQNESKELIGIVTASTSHKAMQISRFINSLPQKYRIVQVGVSETATELNDRIKYKNFFRVLPDDRTQMKMMCDVLVQMQWNYIAVLYENDVYGRQGAELFANCAKEEKIYIGAHLLLNETSLEFIKFHKQKISGFVIIAQYSTVKELFRKDLFHQRKISLFMTEAIEINSELDISTRGDILIVQRAFIKNQQFEDHWKGLFEQVSQNKTPSRYFAKMIEETVPCSFIGVNHSCDMKKAFELIESKASLFQTTESIATGVYVITKILGKIFETPCPTPSCSERFEQSLQAFHKNTSLSFLKDSLGYQRMDFLGAFNTKGSLEYPLNWISYDLFYRYRKSMYNKYNKIGSYTSSGLKLNKTIIQEHSVSFQSAICPVNKRCEEHQRTQDYIYEEGDILFVGILPVHDMGVSNDMGVSKPNSCGKMRSVSGVSLAVAMLFAIKELNERRTYKYIFPGKKIGILILDSCDSDIIIKKKLFALRKNSLSICRDGYNCSEILNKSIVYIGALSSRVSHSVSQIMTAQSTIQISYGSTSATLSNRNEYPNFMRICTPDDQQVKVMIDLLLTFGWKYVSIIYTNELYGISFKDSFINHSMKDGICVIRQIAYDASSNVFEIWNTVRRRQAKVIILFLRGNQVKTFLTKSVDSLMEKEFILIGSESWANKINFGEMAKKIKGSFTLGLEIEENSAFNSYKNERILKEKEMNAWLQNYVAKGCYLPLSMDKRSKKPCDKDYTLNDADLRSPWMPFVIDAIHAAAIGLNKSISEECNNGIICPDLFKNINQVIKNIKDAELEKTGRTFKVFDSNGDGISNYKIFQLHADNKYSKVGNWTKKDGISFGNDFKKPAWKTECPNKKYCSECIRTEKMVSTRRERTKDFTAVLVIFVVLLIVLIVLVAILIYDERKTKNRSTAEVIDMDLRNMNDPDGESDTYQTCRSEFENETPIKTVA